MGSKPSRPVTVANNSSRNVYAKVDKEKKYLTELQTGVDAQVAGQGLGVSGNAKIDWRKIDPGFVEIMMLNHVKFDIVAGKNEQVYVSIVTEEGKVIAENLQKIVPCGLILDSSGFLQDAQEGHIWTPDDPTASAPKRLK